MNSRLSIRCLRLAGFLFLAVVFGPAILAAAPAEIEDPYCGTTQADLIPLSPDALRPPSPAIMQRMPGGKGGDYPTCMTPEHVFFFEDTDGVLAREHTFAELNSLKVEAANALISQYGDNFDFIGFWTDFEPGSRFGGAHYTSVRNDVQGIGRQTFDNHDALGLDGIRTQAFVMMYDYHYRRSKTAPNALAHEFAHHWVLSLSPMPDGRAWGAGHFTCHADQQGGAHGSEWVRSDPAHPRTARFNTDNDGKYSYLVLYLAGYVTADEMDALMSEQRYMDLVDPQAGDCGTRYHGPISTWSSADIIATNGTRIPAADGGAQHDFTAAWILFYQPGEFPRQNHVNKLVRILETFNEDWVRHTIGRGTLRSQLFADTDCDGVPD